MRILYVGDIMAQTGIEVIAQVLPELRRTEQIDLVIAQAENVSEGKGMTLADYERLRSLGVDGFSGGNHTIDRPETAELLTDANAPVTGPANMPDCPGPGFKYITGSQGAVLFVSLLGKIVGKDADKLLVNPILKIDEILLSQRDVPHVATIVNVHGDFSSEKIVMGHYLDGRVTAMIGDHWHVPTADTRILPGGTAHQTDVGMCGALDSSLGVKYDSVVPRWREGKQTRNVLETRKPWQFNAVLVESNDATGRAVSIKQIRKIIEA